ncbi:MAG TPA: DUF3782 domain-containing protein [Thermoanaerobaculia bacterium]|nr:DUF3782 domain-containing protein [Thermoanaerobaculia bacterium]
MADQDLQGLLATLTKKQSELVEQQKETDRQLREVGRQLGGLGDKFGSFTEGLALPSMTKILMQRFGMSTVAPRIKVRRNGRTMELDVLAYSNSGVNTAYVVEVKSHLREDGLEQLRRILREFRDFFPEHAGKKLYGILAAVDIPEDVAQKTLREGIYLARIHDDEFEIQVPEGFQPKTY